LSPAIVVWTVLKYFLFQVKPESCPIYIFGKKDWLKSVLLAILPDNDSG
jgi:hypothetical protein